MKISNSVLIGLGLGVVGLVITRSLLKSGGEIMSEAADLVTTKLNPVSDQNVIYENFVGGIGRSLSGDKNWSLGTWIYDVTH